MSDRFEKDEDLFDLDEDLDDEEEVAEGSVTPGRDPIGVEDEEVDDEGVPIDDFEDEDDED